MARGRAPRGDSPVRWVIWLPGELAAKLELLLYDPVLQRARYGSKSEVCRQALELWLEFKRGPDEEGIETGEREGESLEEVLVQTRT